MRSRALTTALVAALVAVAAPGAPPAAVASFSPSGSVERVEQVKLRFATPMVAFGDPRAGAPVAGSCAKGGNGRWVDAQTYVIDYAQPLAGGQRCTFALVPGLRDASGAAVAGPRTFGFDTGGPALRAVTPRYQELDEAQVFLLALNAAPTPQSAAAGAACLIDGVGEAVPLDLQPDTVRDAILKGAANDWQVRSFLEQAGWRKPDYEEAEIQPRAVIAAAKCRRTLPAGGKVSLRWGAGISAANGLTTAAPQRFDFSVRAAFSARFECSRANPAAACSPLEPLRVRFTGQVPAAQARAIRLTDADGKTYPATAIKASTRLVDSVEFKGPFPEQTKFRVELPADLADDAGRRLVNAARFPLAVATDRAPPLVKFAATFGIVEAAEGGVLPVTVRGVEPRLAGRGVGPIPGRVLSVDSDAEVAQWLRRLDSAEDRTSVEEPIAGSKATRTINTTRSTPLIGPGMAARALAVPKREDSRVMEVVGIPLGPKGFHVVELASPALGSALLSRPGPRYVAAGALNTDMAVHFQWGRGSSLIWVTRLADARPVAGATVRVLDSCTGRAFFEGVTDASGRARVGDVLPEPQSYGSCEYSPSPLMVSARTADDYSFTLTSWSQGIQPSDFGLAGAYGYERIAWHTVFDRTLLKAGERLNMKHFLRTRGDAGLGFGAPPADGKLTIRHLGSDQSYELPLAVGRGGVAESAWAVPAAAALGDYQVEVSGTGMNPAVSGRFQVEEYRLPTIRAVVSGPKGRLVAPKVVPVDLALAYLSGGGAGGAAVTLRTRVEPREVSVADYEGWTFGGEPVVEGVVPLDGDGDAPPVPLRARTEPVTLGANGAARIGVGDIGPVARPSRLVAEMDYEDANGEIATQSARIDLDPASVRVGIRTDGWLAKADDLRLKLVALDLAGKPVRGQRIEVRLFSRETYSYRKRLIGGFYAYDNSRETKALDAECSGTTDDKGLLLCAIDTGTSGEVLVQATAADSAGRQSRAVLSTWLAGDDDWWFGGDNGDRMDVVAEQPEYAAGGTARLQVRMPFRRATALVSVLGDGVIDSFVTELSGKDPVIEVKLKRGYAPNVHVSVLAVRGRVAGWRLWLADLARRWDLPWISRDAARPTALVDLAKPSYRFGMVKLKVGWEANRLDVRVAADRPSYAVRQVARTTVQVTPPAGRPLPAGSEIAFAAVDEALLQLKDNDSWDVLAAMLAERPVAVVTATAQTQVVGKRHYGRKAVAAGGDGGAAVGAARRDFRPLLLWRGRVPLDAQGRARIDVPLSDALSSFRLVAVASGGADLFGLGSTNVRTTQDLQILPGIPPMVRTGDRYTATVVVRNASARAFDASVTARAGPAALPARRVTIAAGGAATLAWEVIAPADAATLPWAVDAVAGASRDAVRVTQTVVPAVPVTTLQATLLQLDAAREMPVALPAGALPGRGGIAVALSRTLGGALPGVRDYMRAYPYDCIEQQLSKAVALGDRAAWDRSAAAIPAYLDANGLLKFFPADWLEGNESLTAYVLHLSATNGWPLPAASRARMVAGLTGQLAQSADDTEAPWRIAALAGLALNGAANPGLLEAVAVNPDRWPSVTLIDWLEALRALPAFAGREQRIAQATEVLRARLALQGTRLDIARADDAGAFLYSADATAARLVLLASVAPEWREDAGRLARGLMLRQRRGHWDTTVANAVGTLAVARFSARFESVPVSGTTRATLAAGERSFEWPASGAPTPALLAWPAGQARLALSHSGSGAPWVTVSARAALPLARPLSAGFAASRRVTAVTRAVAGRWTRGDVLRVEVSFTPQAPLEWVVVNDPVPAGATILGGSLGGRGTMLTDGEAGGGLQPSFVERRADAVHAHYASVPRATVTYSYTVRLSSSGRFSLPPTRVEALYAPEMFAALPNAPVAVTAK